MKNIYDEQEYSAFILNDESEGPDNEFDPSNLDTEMIRFNNESDE